MTRTTGELQEARTHSMRRGGMFPGSVGLMALTLLGLGFGVGLGDAGFAATAENTGARRARDVGFAVVTSGETPESVRAYDRTRPVPERTLRAVGAAGTGHECVETTSTSVPNKLLMLRAMHLGSSCGMGTPCSATKLYARDNNGKGALSIVSSRNRSTGGRYDDRNSIR